MIGAKILWAIIGGFLFGVFLRSFLPLGLAFVGFAALLAVAALLLGFVGQAHRRSTIIIAIALLTLGAGVIRMHTAVLVGDPALTARLDKSVVLEGVVPGEPDVRDTGVRIPVAATSIVASTSIPVAAGILVLAPPHTNIAYGDAVRVLGTLRLPQAFDTGLGRKFDYPKYLAKDGIGYELAFAKVERTGENTGDPVLAAAIRAKQIYLSGLDIVLAEPEAGLAGGITVGDKRGLGVDLSQTFRAVGLVHVVVLSGYNITLVMNFVRSILQLLPRFFQYGGVTLAVVFFILMSGGASSAVRAGAMALIAVFARATGRVYLAGRILGVVAFCMVLYNPFTLAFDPSFQLSALATLGLISFTPIFAARLTWLTEKFALREIASSTLGTQLAVLPLLLYQNGQLPIYSLPANLLALVAVPFAMFASVVASIAGMLMGSFGVPIALPAYALLAYIINVAKLFAALPFAALSIPAFSAWWVFAAYGIMFGGLWVHKKTRPAGGGPRSN